MRERGQAKVKVKGWVRPRLISKGSLAQWSLLPPPRRDSIARTARSTIHRSGWKSTTASADPKLEYKAPIFDGEEDGRWFTIRSQQTAVGTTAE